MDRKKIGIVSLILLAGTFGLTRAQKEEGSSSAGRTASPEVVTLRGEITGMDRPRVRLEADGREYHLHLGPAWFWEAKGDPLAEGDEVVITGEVERYRDHQDLYPRKIEHDGETYLLTDDDGKPLWPRPGRGARHGWGAGGRGGGRGGWHHHGDCGDCPHAPCPDPGCPYR